jgi:hypothetical protein
MKYSSELKQHLERTENEIKSKINIDPQVAICLLTQVLDTAYLHENVFRDGSDVDSDKLGLYSEGWLTAIRNVFEKYPDLSSRSYAKRVPIDDDLRSWALTLLSNFGNLSYANRLITAYELDLANLRKNSEGDFVFIFDRDSAGKERIERRDFEALRSNIIQEDAEEWEELKAERNKKIKKMENYVDTWRKHYIQYESSPEIDAFYTRYGEIFSKRLFGKEALPENCEINGVEYQKYKRLLKELIGLAFKHLDFCLALTAKNKSVDFENLLGVVRDKDTYPDSLSSYLKLERTDVSKILKCLTYTKQEKNKKSFFSIPQPPFIEISSHQILESIVGIISNPYFYMNRKIEDLYPEEWNKRIQFREKKFRNDLYDLLDTHFMSKKDSEITIRSNNKDITDIDALIMDERSNSIGVFQLKWQRPFGNSLMERESRKRNFREEADEWINKIKTWLEQSDAQEKSSTLRIKKHKIHSLDNIYIFVIGRNFSCFSGTKNRPENTAWGNWAQINQILRELRTEERTLKRLYATLRENSPHGKKSSVQNIEEKFKVEDITIKTVLN